MKNQSIAQALSQSELSLEPYSETASLDAAILLASVLKKSRAYLLAHAEEPLSAAEQNVFDAMVARRQAGVAIAYLTGEKEFWSLTLAVDPAVLVPRPETELLVELSLEQFSTSAAINAVDLGTGSGAIALAMARECPKWQIYATDVSHNALRVAEKNLQALGINNVLLRHGNWFEALDRHDFDLILSNPPYLSVGEWEANRFHLAQEPYAALVSEENGYLAIDTIISRAPQYLRNRGILMIEHGHLQGKKTRESFSRAGFSNVETRNDLSGKERVTLGRLDQ